MTFLRFQVPDVSTVSASTLKGLVITSALLVSACASHSERHYQAGYGSQETYKTRHPIVIDEKEQTLDIPLTSASYGLPRGTVSSVEGFADQFRRTASGTITVMLPSGSPNERAARQLVPTIMRAITDMGVSRNRIRTTRYDASRHGTSAPIRLSYVGMHAGVTGCGRWPGDLAAESTQNRNYHNFGCASQSNLAAQVANPADLLGPRGVTPIDATRRNNVINDYRRSGNGG